ncbi:hypothetical protein GQ54DRAFT_41558 [Martensiomyces pterosporus]|nr:hypothetical protein GQ54DRAFT_41558 [Martensiomyces pterosporus]
MPYVNKNPNLCTCVEQNVPAQRKKRQLRCCAIRGMNEQRCANVRWSVECLLLRCGHLIYDFAHPHMRLFSIASIPCCYPYIHAHRNMANCVCLLPQSPDLLAATVNCLEFVSSLCKPRQDRAELSASWPPRPIRCAFMHCVHHEHLPCFSPIHGTQATNAGLLSSLWRVELMASHDSEIARHRCFGTQTKARRGSREAPSGFAFLVGVEGEIRRCLFWKISYRAFGLCEADGRYFLGCSRRRYTQASSEQTGEKHGQS